MENHTDHLWEIHKPVVQSLIRLIQLRNSHPAFDGEFSLRECSEHEICLSWAKDEVSTRLNINLLTTTFTITYQDDSSGKELIL